MMTQIEDQTSADREPRIEVLRVPEELDLASADGLAEQPYAANNENMRIDGLDWRSRCIRLSTTRLEHLAPIVGPSCGEKGKPPDDGSARSQ